MKFVRTLVAVVLAASALTTVQGFVSYVNERGNVLRWNLVAPPSFVHTNVVNRNTKAIRYFIASDAYSAANKTAELNAIRACFAQWQSVPGSILKFEEGGLVNPGIDVNTADKFNVIFWAKKSLLVNNGMDDLHGLHGLTVTAFNSDNTMLEADTVLNGIQFGWFTDFNNTINADAFIESSALHEIGHFIGLDHSPVGGATVVTDAGPGVNTEAGLSSDEIAAVQALYPQPATTANLGFLRGRVLMLGNAVFGAMVVAENAAGNLAAGTVSRTNGNYELPALQPGKYSIRVCPLDPATADRFSSLMRGQDIAFDYDSAQTSFFPTPNKQVTLAPGLTNVLDFTLVPGEPPFRITAISRPSDRPDDNTADRWASAVRLGQNNFWVGVSSATLPTNGATLSVTGDGLTIGPTVIKPNRFLGGVHLLLAMVSVANNATPGLRSLVVEHSGNFGYANGYLEILPSFPDFNFDGLDDQFQRQYFPLFTAPQAAPGADADGDGFSNLHEFNTGTNPTDPASFRFRIESVKLTNEGSTITFQSGPGKRYQLFSRTDVVGSPWEPLGASLLARGSLTQFVDKSATNEMRFYRVQAVP